jgi:hypothetical protein
LLPSAMRDVTKAARQITNRFVKSSDESADETSTK